MRNRITVSAEIKSLQATFLVREMRLERMVRRGDTEVMRRTPVKVVDFHGITLEYNFLLKLLGVLKQTRVESVTIEAVPDGLHLLFDRAFYFLRGVDHGR